MSVQKEEKFKQIILENESRIQSICRHYCSNAEDRKDMYQEILVNIWKSLDSFRGDSKLSTWIYRVAVNTSLSFAGKAFRDMKLMVHTDERYLGNLFNSDDDDLKQKQQFEVDLDRLQTEMNLMSVIDKALISLMLEGLSMREIADVIGLTETNVRVKIHRIKSDLRNAFSTPSEIVQHDAESLQKLLTK